MNKLCDDISEFACPMEGISAFDNPNLGIAYNLYQCNRCGMLVKYDVWDNKGTTFLKNDNTVIRKSDE